MKPLIAFLLTAGVLVFRPTAMLYLWLSTGPIIGNFMDRPFFYALFSSKRVWDIWETVTMGFDPVKLLAFDRVVLLGLLLVVLSSRRFRRARPTRVDYAFIALLGTLALSCVFSNFQLNALRTLMDTFGLCWVAFFLGKNMVWEDREFRGVLASSTILAGILVSIGVVENSLFGDTPLYRITGPFRYWETMGSTLSILVFLLWYRAATSTAPPDSRWSKRLYFLIIVLAGYCIFLTQTRTAMAGVLLGTVAYAFFGRAIIGRAAFRRIFVAVLALLLLLAVAPAFLAESSFYKDTIQRETVDDRMEQYLAAKRMFKAHPVFGIGFNNYQSEFGNYVADEELRWSVPGLTTFHNSYGVTLVEAGLLGLLPLLFLVYSSFHLLLRSYRDAPDREGKVWSLAVLAMGVGYYMAALTFDMFYIPTIDNKLFYLFLGITAARRERAGA